MSEPACLFCLRAGRPMTREHVFPQWLVRRVRGARLVASGLEEWTPTRLARLTVTVCADCNAGWMSALEVTFRRAFFARPRSGGIRPMERVIFSRWFTKTAVLVASAHGAALVDATRRPELLKGMPAGTDVFIARRRRPPQRLDLAIDLGSDDASALVARSVAILVDEVVAHVAPVGILGSAHGTRLWPLRTHALRWETLPVIRSPASDR